MSRTKIHILTLTLNKYLVNLDYIGIFVFFVAFEIHFNKGYLSFAFFPHKNNTNAGSGSASFQCHTRKLTNFIRSIILGTKTFYRNESGRWLTFFVIGLQRVFFSYFPILQSFYDYIQSSIENLTCLYH